MDPKFLLTEEDFERAATTLGCSVSVIKAVSQVESAGSGVNPDGTLKTLFEGHYFSRFTDNKYDTEYPSISYPKWTREYYGKGWKAEQARLEQAKVLDLEAALRSASWGMFQIMGDNYKLCGYNSVIEFVNALQDGAGPQLDAFVSFIQNKHLEDELRNLNWEGFARVYNGSGQVAAYGKLLADAYAKIKSQSSDDTLTSTPT